MHSSTRILLATTGALLLAGAANAQGRSGSAPGHAGPPPGAGIGAGIGAGAGIGGPAGSAFRTDPFAGSQAAQSASDRAKARADIHSPIGTTTHPQARDDEDQTGVTTRETARANRQGPAKAADQAVTNANAKAGLSTAGAGGASLAALATGQVVRDSTGATLGKVRRVERSKDGTVRAVLVDADDSHRTISLRPDTLSISGGVVTTTRVTKH